MSEDKIAEIESKYKENIEDKVSGFIISVTDYQFLMSVNAAFRAELAEKEKQVENLNNIIKRGCEDEDSQCPQLERAEKLDAENAALREQLKKMEEAKEYKDHEFCKDVECTALEHGVCTAYVCHKTAKHFHQWLKQNGYKIIKAACEA